MTKQKILITGGAGFIGSHLAELLLREKMEVIIIDNLSTGQLERIPKEATFYKEDIRDTKSLITSMQECDYVFHLAASARIQRSWDYPQETWDINVNGTYSVLEAARQAKVKRIMITSSNSVYGKWGTSAYHQQRIQMTEDLQCQPLNPYAYHKMINEIQARFFRSCYIMNVFVVRPFNVYGPYQPIHHEYATVIPKFIEQKKKKQPLTIYGDGQQSRDFTHVYDVVQAMYQLMISKKTKAGEIYNIARDVNVSINNLAKMFHCPFAYFPSPRQGEMYWTKGESRKLYETTGFKPGLNIEDFIE